MNDSAAGLGCCNLVCPQRHRVGQLLKHVSHLPTQIDLPGNARENWPREADAVRTSAYCPWCEGWYGADTSNLRAAFGDLVSDENDHERDYLLDRQDSEE